MVCGYGNLEEVPLCGELICPEAVRLRGQDTWPEAVPLRVSRSVVNMANLRRYNYAGCALRDGC